MPKDRGSIRRTAMVLATVASMLFALSARAEDEAPWLGRYEVRSAPIPAGTVINILVLDTGSTYTLYDSIGAVLIGRGDYTFNANPAASESHYTWLSGPLQNRHYGGTLYIESGGRAHRIQLEAHVYAITTDGPVWRPQ
jgi:hypothetical protein